MKKLSERMLERAKQGAEWGGVLAENLRAFAGRVAALESQLDIWEQGTIEAAKLQEQFLAERDQLRAENKRMAFRMRSAIEASGIQLGNPSGDLCDEFANVMQAYLLKANNYRAQLERAQAHIKLAESAGVVFYSHQDTNGNAILGCSVTQDKDLVDGLNEWANRAEAAEKDLKEWRDTFSGHFEAVPENKLSLTPGLVFNILQSLTKERDQLRAQLESAKDVLLEYEKTDPSRLTHAALSALNTEIQLAIKNEYDNLLKVRATVGHFVAAVIRCENRLRATKRRLDWFITHKNSIMYDQEHRCWTINWGSLAGKDIFDTPYAAIDAAMTMEEQNNASRT